MSKDLNLNNPESRYIWFVYTVYLLDYTVLICPDGNQSAIHSQRRQFHEKHIAVGRVCAKVRREHRLLGILLS